MICQISNIQTKTGVLPSINKGLLQVRHLQAKLRQSNFASASEHGQSWSPITSGPYLVPVSRWAE